MSDEPVARTTRPFLLFGGSGQVGRRLLDTLAPLATVIAPTRGEADLTRPAAVRELIERVRPSVVINTAALTNVDQAEREPLLAHAVNEIAPGVMADGARAVGALLVHYSTDYVFDGATTTPYDETARPNPINVYGVSKLGGEQRIAQAGAPHLIIRTSWVYSASGSGFVATLLRDLPNRETVRVVFDQVGSPTWSRSLARATAAILGSLARDGFRLVPDDWGIYHLAGSGEGSRLQIAETIVDSLCAAGVRIRARIVPISATEFAAAAPRPHYSALSHGRATKRFGVSLEPWRSELRQMVATRSD